MAYSTDSRKRVLDFIQTGGKKSEAARRFSVDRSTIYRWLASAEDPLAIEKPGPKKMSVLDEAETLRKHFSDLTQNERASHFGVSASSIGNPGLRKLSITRKKQSDIRSCAMPNVVPIVKHLWRSRCPLAKR